MGAPVVPVAFEETKPSDEAFLESINPDKAYNKFKQAIGQGPNAQAANQRMTEAQQLYDAKKFGNAAGLFQKAAEKATTVDMRQRALYLAAESYFFADEYDKANDAYEMLLKKFPSTQYLDTAIGRQWLIAQYWEKVAVKKPDWSYVPNVTDSTRPSFDTAGQAIRVYENIRMNDPTGPWADDAVMATAASHFRRGRFEDADHYFTTLRETYPKSEHQFLAHLLGLQSKLRIYQGPKYDPGPLNAAEKLAKQLRQQFSGKLSPEERQRVEEIDKQIAKQQALRHWKMAEYYDKGDHFGAAKQYYIRVVEKYPNTELANQAKTRLAAITNQPDSPDEHLAWLIKYFPESREHAKMAIPMNKETIRR